MVIGAWSAPSAGITQIRYTGRRQNGHPLSLALPSSPRFGLWWVIIL